MFDSEGLIKIHRTRANSIANIIVFSFIVVLARLWYLQVYKGDLLLDYSLRNRLRKEIVEAPRGMMFDRNNNLIVNNIPRFDAVLTPQYFKEQNKTLKRISDILEIPLPQIKAILAKRSNLARYKSITLKKNISWKEVSIIETENDELPGISVETFISREYIDKEVGAHLLGYISEISETQLPRYRKRDNLDYNLGDFIGQTGIEQEYDHVIRGKNGHEFVEVDAKGRKKKRINTDKLFEGITNSPSVPGLNVLLTIDKDLQLEAYKALEGWEGAVVVVDIETGEILTMVSRPSFDPGLFSRGINSKIWNDLSTDEYRPMRDRAIQEHYSPGSTFKPFMALAALEEGIIDEKIETFCNGQFKLGRRVFHCWKKFGHQNVDIPKSLRESCNVFYYKIGKRLDIDQLYHYAGLFGLGKRTGISLPREVSGLVPNREWKKKTRGEEWMLGETISCVIGQSYILASPLQLAMAYATIANGGKLLKPIVVKEIFSNSGMVYKKYQTEVVNEIKMNPKYFAVVREGLKQVVNNPKGTAYWYRGKGAMMAGKSGTSQLIRIAADKLFNKEGVADKKLQHHGLFVGYAPYDNPKVAVAVIAEHGRGGSKSAAPVASVVIATYLKKYWPKIYEEAMKRDKATSHIATPPPTNEPQDEGED